MRITGEEGACGSALELKQGGRKYGERGGCGKKGKVEGKGKRKRGGEMRL